MPSSSATRSRRPISNRIRITGRTCSTAMSPMPMRGSRIQDYKDPDTGQLMNRELLNQELSKIEKPAGIANPKDFRNEVVKFALRARAANSGRNPSWTSYEKLREVIERRMFSQVEDLLPVISFGSQEGQRHREEARRLPRADGRRAATPSARCAAWSSGTCGSTRPGRWRERCLLWREDDEHCRPPAQPQGQEPQQPAAFPVAGPRRGQSRRCRTRCASARSPMSSTARRWRSRCAGSSSRRSTTAGAPAATSTSCPATRSMSGATRSRARAAARGSGGSQGQPGRVGRGRLRIHPVEGRVPRYVLRGSRTARPGQKEPASETFAVDLQRAGYTVTGSPANLSIRRTMRNSMARRISLRRPKQWEVEALRAGARRGARPRRRGRGAKTNARPRTGRIPQQDHPLHRPDRCPLQSLRTRAASPIPRRSCSA